MKKNLLASGLVFMILFLQVLIGQNVSQNITWSVCLEKAPPDAFQKRISMEILNICDSSENTFEEFTCTIDTEYVKLIFDFSVSELADSFILDLYTFVPFNIWREEFINLDAVTFDDGLLPGDFLHNQVIIENQHNEFRYFYKGKLKPGIVYSPRTAPVSTVTTENYTLISLSPNNNARRLTPRWNMLKECLRVRDEDQYVRFHYVFNPSQEQKLNGYDSRIITSNWIAL